MQATLRAWTLALLGLFLAIFAVVVQRSFLLIAAAALGAWLLTAQYIASRTFQRVQNTLSVACTPAPISNTS